MKRRAQKGRRLRLLIAFLGAFAIAMLLVWKAIHTFPSVGPFLADTGRKVLGPDAIAKLEDFAYAKQDRYLRWTKRHTEPVAYWTVEPMPSAAPTATGSAPVDAVAGPPPFTLEPLGPVYKEWSAAGDGIWSPIHDAQHPSDAPRMLKTLLHPDRNRSWAATMVVAIDLSSADIQFMLGRYEPSTERREARTLERPGLVPPSAVAELLATFNGGFKTEHGEHGAMVEGVTLVPPKPHLCTIAKYRDGRIAIARWSNLDSTANEMLWWRQSPQCMVENGKTHPGILGKDDTTAWGATLDKDTVIRRSAIAINEQGTVFFVGIGDSVTAGALARSMKHAGGFTVAQLDVNWSFPKFLTYEPRSEDGQLVAKAFTKSFEFSEDEYIRKPSNRDFFYVTRRPPTLL